MAGTGSGGENRYPLLRGFHPHAAYLRLLGGLSGLGAHYVDGFFFRVLAAAGLFPRALCRRAGRKLLSRVRQSTPPGPLSLRFAAGVGRGGRGLLLAAPGRRDCRPGGHSHHDPVSYPSRWVDRAALPPPRSEI